VEGAEVAGGDPSSGFAGVSAAGPLVQVLPQMLVQALEGLLGRPRPEVVRLASDDRVEGSDHVGRVGAAQAAQFLGEPLPDLLQCGATGFAEDLGSAADVVAANREGQEIEPGGLFISREEE
jgi:hypothetical protein